MGKKVKSKAEEKIQEKNVSNPLNRRAADREMATLKNELAGVCLLAAALTFLLSMVSFEPLADSLEANSQTNLIGPVGAYLADSLFFVLGVTAYLVPLTFAFPGFCFVFGKPMQLRISAGVGLPLFLMLGSILAHLYLEPRIVYGYPAGGLVGGHGGEILKAFIGFWGALIVVYLILIVAVLWTTKLSLRFLNQSYCLPALRWCASQLHQSAQFIRQQFSAIQFTKELATESSGPSGRSGGLDAIPDYTDAERKRPVIHNPSPLTDEMPTASSMNEQTDSISQPVIEALPEEEKVNHLGLAEHIAQPVSGEIESISTEEEPKPIVKRRKTPGPEAEQIEIPLAVVEQRPEYRLPPLHYLDFDDSSRVEIDPEFLQAQAIKLVDALKTFKIEGRVTEIHPGPVVTMYEFEPAPGVRISRIAGLADDLAMALKAVKVRIVAPIPGKGVVGFEVPNIEREVVWMKEIIGSKAFNNKKMNLPMALGKDIHGDAVVTDLSKMPHLLVAGTTGSGKSVGVNGMITSLLYRLNPDEVRFIMVDPKMLELSIYEGIPHLLLPVVTDPKKAALALRWAVDEMERRYALMKDAGVRDIRGYNRKLEKGKAEEMAATLRAQAEAIETAASGDEEGHDTSVMPSSAPEVSSEQKLPYIVVVIDEFADLMMVAGKEVEYCVARIAQKARAAGIHLILATQRPSTDVITGVIKANFPTRIAFQVSSAIDSRTILSTNGAENLLGKGDMLFMPPGTSKLTRVHGAFISEEEIHEVVEFIGDQMEPVYLDDSILEEPVEDEAGDDRQSDDDPMYEEAVRVVARDGRASTSHLQRRLSLGYNRAARIVDQMEKDGLVGPSKGAKPREVYAHLISELVNRWDAA